MKRSTILHISGMSCNGCIFNIISTLMRKKGIEHVDIDLKSERSNIQYNDSLVSFIDIQQTIKNLGFRVEFSK